MLGSDIIDAHSKEAGDWPPEIDEEYERVMPLGEGAFGIVWLAKAKKDTSSTTAPQDDDDDDSVDPSEREDAFDVADGSNGVANHRRTAARPNYVAIKQIIAGKDDEKQYAEREIAILSEIHHPNVVKCLNSVEMPRCKVVVLTLANGPDLGELVTAGGALSVSLARLAARHLISAVAYLHGRGVIHRDIKPDNCILEKVDTAVHLRSTKDDWMSNDSFWDDKAEFRSEEWKIVLVDFGFARALTPEECMQHTSERGSLKKSAPSVRNLVQASIQQQEEQFQKDEDPTPSPSSRPGNRGSMRRGASFQRVTRAMSSLGTRAFAAPEVRQVRKKDGGDNALTGHVSDYGLLADAYSIGVTIKVLLTGVPAEENEMDFISAHDNLFLNMITALFSCGKGGGKQQKKRYKFLDEAPKPARELVKKLIKPVVADRLTVPLARDEPWIKGGTDPDDPVVSLPMGDIPAGIDDPIRCLDCASKF